MVRKSLMALAIIIFSLGCLLSCGLESIPYLGYVPDDVVDITDVSRVTVSLQSRENYASYFTNYIIFYRIYISGIGDIGKVDESWQRSDINPTLNTDFISILPMTDKSSTTINTTNLESYFFGRNYYQLTLERASIDSVLSATSGTLEIFFQQGQFNPSQTENFPRLSLNGATYILQRANSGPALSFRPLPDNRYFLNDRELYDSANAIRETNADVANRTADPPSRYTYVSMYIAAVGQDYLTTIYSQPTFLGILKLPDSFNVD